MKILVIGDCCLDVFIYGICNRLAPDAPVPVLNKTKTETNLGMAGNVLNNIKSMGVEADLICNKNFPEMLKTRFVEERTNHMFIRVDESDTCHPLEPTALKDVLWEDYEAVVISDYCKGFLTDDLIKTISTLHPLTFLDSKRPLGPWAKKISFIKINGWEYNKTKHLIDKKFIENMIITMGDEGCYYQGMVYPVSEVKVKDVSGAGDSFLAALVVKYSETKNMDQSIKFANACATKVVQQQGITTIGIKE